MRILTRGPLLVRIPIDSFTLRMLNKNLGVLHRQLDPEDISYHVLYPAHDLLEALPPGHVLRRRATHALQKLLGCEQGPQPVHLPCGERLSQLVHHLLIARGAGLLPDLLILIDDHQGVLILVLLQRGPMAILRVSSPHFARTCLQHREGVIC